MLTVELAVTCRLHGELIAPHQTKLIDSFVAFAAFWPMVFLFAQAKQKWKNYRDQGRLTFSAPPHQTPPHRITSLLNSLFSVRVSAPKCESARRLILKRKFQWVKRTFKVRFRRVFNVFRWNLERTMPDNQAKKWCQGFFIFCFFQKLWLF